jgi:hypothetical protein
MRDEENASTKFKAAKLKQAPSSNHQAPNFKKSFVWDLWLVMEFVCNF